MICLVPNSDVVVRDGRGLKPEAAARPLDRTIDLRSPNRGV